MQTGVGDSRVTQENPLKLWEAAQISERHIVDIFPAQAQVPQVWHLLQAFQARTADSSWIGVEDFKFDQPTKILQSRIRDWSVRDVELSDVCEVRGILQYRLVDLRGRDIERREFREAAEVRIDDIRVLEIEAHEFGLPTQLLQAGIGDS